jgi:hypothetical protein
MVQRVWRANQLKPHLVKTFKVSNEPHFVEKLTDVVGLYLNPPEHALVLSCDEQTRIQALDRTQRSLPLKQGRCGTLTHDYVRNGTTTLFAALNLLDGRVIGRHEPRHRHQEWLKFLRQIDQETPAELDLHLSVDNYATHKHPRVRCAEFVLAGRNIALRADKRDRPDDETQVFTSSDRRAGGPPATARGPTASTEPKEKPAARRPAFQDLHVQRESAVRTS